MENIILMGHGSPKNDANHIELVGRLLHTAIHPGCRNGCIKVAYLQFAEPKIEEAIKNCVNDGARRIIMHPYFLSNGMHVTKDIPEIINAARKMYPDIEFIYTEPLGIHEKLVHVVMDRIFSAAGMRPHEIERRSMEIISEEIDLSGIPDEQLPVVKRVIHATADFEFKDTLVFHHNAIRTGIDAIRSGKDILTDVEMVKTGINKSFLENWGGKVVCGIRDAGCATQDAGDVQNRTRAELGIESALTKNGNIGIIAIGNAPTALLKAVDFFHRASCLTYGSAAPLVIGVPVGFVRALESKTLLSVQKFPFITNLSRKGGTPVAVAIVNALLKMAEEI